MPLHIAIAGADSKKGRARLSDREGNVLYFDGNATEALEAFQAYADVMGIEDDIEVFEVERIPESGYKPLKLNVHA